MQVEGQLRFEMRANDSGAYAVTLQSTRPVHASKVFVGRKPEEVIAMLPRLFRICAVAQTDAAARALQQATGRPGHDQVDAARRSLVLLETTREHAWRMLVDWPTLLGQQPELDRIRQLDALLAEIRQPLCSTGDAFQLDALPTTCLPNVALLPLRRFLREAIFGVFPDEWLQTASITALEHWSCAQATSTAQFINYVFDRGWQDVGSTKVTALPPLTGAEIDCRLRAADADDFIERPMWEGKPCETTPLQRMRHHPLLQAICAEFGAGLLSRAVAELAELASLPGAVAAALEDDPGRAGAGLPPKTGVGQVEAARGRLVHRVVLDADQVTHYQIVAPTEWNFHPHGALLSGLAKLPRRDAGDVRRMGSMLITTVDPCVGFSLAVH